MTAPAPAPAAVPAMTAGRLLGAYLSEARYEALRLLRMPAFSIPILVLPIVMYLFFAVLIAGGRGGPPVANWMYVGWTVFAIMGPGLFGFGILVALERNQGLLTFKRALPMPPGVYLTAKIAMSMVFAAGVMAMLAAAGVLFGGVTLAPLQLVTVSAVMALGVAPACAIGLFIGASVPAQVAPAIANIVYLAMAFLGGLFFPLPPAMQALRSIWPTYHLAQLALASGGLPSQGAAWTHAAVLAGLTLVLTALAAQRLARAG